MTITRYIRYSAAGKTSYGILEGETVREIRGDLFAGAEATGNTLSLAQVKLLAPCEPSKVVAVGRNYKSHIADRNIEPAKEPGLFWKPSSCIVGTGEDIVLPDGANNVHYEAEMVVVIGKEAKNIKQADAAGAIFGITAGNAQPARGIILDRVHDNAEMQRHARIAMQRLDEARALGRDAAAHRARQSLQHRHLGAARTCR